jgi:phage terminase Nu1 subunit (DNA packaging protein)
LFRISASASQVQELKQLFDQVEEVSVDLTKFTAHSIAGVLKLFLREIPDPLLGYQMYDKAVNILGRNFTLFIVSNV